MSPAQTEAIGRRHGQADDAIDQIEEASAALAELVSREMDLEDERPVVKQAAIARLMQTENPLTKKPHSASSAEAVVELDPEYLVHRLNQRFAAEQTITARGRYEAAKRRADLAVEMVRVQREAAS